MSGRTHSPPAPPSDDEGRSDSEVVVDLLDRYAKARKLLLELMDADDGTIASRKAIALQERKVWTLFSLRRQQALDPDGAAKASAQSVKLGELAVRLEKSTMADRVLALERLVADSRRAGAAVRRAASARRA